MKSYCRKILFLVLINTFYVNLYGFVEDNYDLIEQQNNLNQIENKKLAYRVPGTYWCGAGSIAKQYNQLGKFSSVDRCCRAHDICDSMERGQHKYGLKNTFMISKLHCKCDKEFRKCLQKIGTKLANTVGRLYFSIQDKCYKEDYPIVGCKNKAKSLMRSRCTHYMTDVSKPKKFQWFDLPFYFDPQECDAFKE